MQVHDLVGNISNVVFKVNSHYYNNDELSVYS